MAVVTNAAGGMSSVTSMTSAVGLGVGGLVVSVALVYLLVYFNLVDSSAVEFDAVRRFVAATIVPLSLVFVGIVAFQTLQVL